MPSTLNAYYDADFYSAHQNGMTNSAMHVLSLLQKYYKPKSVVDVGCGRGAWLAVAESFGCNKLKGFDGSWVQKEDLLSKNIDFTSVNFDLAMPEIDEKYELCISLEVAEHIPENKAKNFVDFICKSSDIVIFSAAIKYQGGENHINTQWQSYWVDLFKHNGYECFDIIRANIWNNESVEVWYRQNILVFSRKNNCLVDNELFKAAEKPIYDVVHPKNYESKILEIQFPTLRFVIGCAIGYISNIIKCFNGNSH